MTDTKVGTLKARGGSLHYEFSGAGPVLLLIPGAPVDAAIFGGLRAALEDRFTVVAYDLRGLSRSTFDGEPEDMDAEVLGEDALTVLNEFGTEPADVLAVSGGAHGGFELVAKHPERVRTLVVHEPPLMGLLPDGEEWKAFFAQMYETYKTMGSGAAMGMFMAMAAGMAGPGIDPAVAAEMPPPPMPDPSQMPPEALEMMGRMQGNMEYFFAHQLQPGIVYEPDFDALKAAATKIVLAAGTESAGTPPHKVALVLAERLGTEVVEFPGDHQGFNGVPGEFAETLVKVLRED